MSAWRVPGFGFMARRSTVQTRLTASVLFSGVSSRPIPVLYPLFLPSLLSPRLRPQLVLVAGMTSQTHLNGASAPTDKAARRKRFEDVFPVIAEELLGYVRGEGMPQDAVEWFERVSEDGVVQL
jgi:hypothetical protein